MKSVEAFFSTTFFMDGVVLPEADRRGDEGYSGLIISYVM